MLEVVTQPTLRAISVVEALAFLRQSATSEGSLLEALIDAARSKAELGAGRTLLTTVYDLKLPAFPHTIRLPRPPVQSVTSVSYYDKDNVAQTVTVTTGYLAYVGERSGEVYLPQATTWPTTYDRPDAVTVRYTAGWTAATLVPGCLRAWMFQAVATLYEHREHVITGTIATQLPRDFCDGLLDPERIPNYL